MFRLAALSFLVLCLSAPAAGTPYGVLLNGQASIGSSTAVHLTADGMSDGKSVAYVFFGTAAGASTVRVNGRDVVIPLAEGAWLAARSTVEDGLGGVAGVVPPDAGLVGATLHAAVVVVRRDGSFYVSARTGGPIIQDAIA